MLDDDGAFPNANVYQLITYCLRLGLPAGHLVYAGGSPTRPDTYVIRQAGISLHVHAIDLTQDVSGIETQVQVLTLHGHLASAMGGQASTA
ncbi:hypothetical protein ACI8AC_06445 [Geodermatophilus sp. SYSU D00758]